MALGRHETAGKVIFILCKRERDGEEKCYDKIFFSLIVREIECLLTLVGVDNVCQTEKCLSGILISCHEHTLRVQVE